MNDIGELCQRTVWIASEDEPVRDAAQRMRDHHVGCLVVVDERDGARIPVGIVTDRDLALRVLAAGRDPERTFVRDVMTRELVRAREAEPVSDVVSRMRAFGVRRVPVIDSGDRLLGIIALDDLLELLAGEIGALSRLLARERARERG